jgi:hypothetical protein
LKTGKYPIKINAVLVQHVFSASRIAQNLDNEIELGEAIAYTTPSITSTRPSIMRYSAPPFETQAVHRLIPVFSRWRVQHSRLLRL